MFAGCCRLSAACVIGGMGVEEKAPWRIGRCIPSSEGPRAAGAGSFERMQE